MPRGGERSGSQSLRQNGNRRIGGPQCEKSSSGLCVFKSISCPLPDAWHFLASHSGRTKDQNAYC